MVNIDTDAQDVAPAVGRVTPPALLHLRGVLPCHALIHHLEMHRPVTGRFRVALPTRCGAGLRMAKFGDPPRLDSVTIRASLTEAGFDGALDRALVSLAPRRLQLAAGLPQQLEALVTLAGGITFSELRSASDSRSTSRSRSTGGFLGGTLIMRSISFIIPVPVLGVETAGEVGVGFVARPTGVGASEVAGAPGGWCFSWSSAGAPGQAPPTPLTRWPSPSRLPRPPG